MALCTIMAVLLLLFHVPSAEEKIYNSDVDAFFEDIKRNLTEEWADQVENWEHCGANMMPCPNVYVTEGIKVACTWAYKDVEEGSVPEDEQLKSKEDDTPIPVDRRTTTSLGLIALFLRFFTIPLAISSLWVMATDKQLLDGYGKVSNMQFKLM